MIVLLDNLSLRILYHAGKFKAIADVLLRRRVPNGMDSERVKIYHGIINKAHNCMIVCVHTIKTLGQKARSDEDKVLDDDCPP